VREYIEQRYLPAAAALQSRVADKGAIGRKIVDWHRSLQQKWAALHFGEVKVDTRGGQYAFEVQVYCNDLDPNSMRVELYADGIKDGAPFRQEMKRERQLTGTTRGYAYTAQIPSERPPAEYTIRAIPFFPGVAVPLEAPRILWQR
jgi:starch phosphorylase